MRWPLALAFGALFGCSSSEGRGTEGGGNGDAGNLDGGSTAEPLLVWTFNLLNPSNPLSPGGDVEVRTQMVIDAIDAERPDLVAFQEVVDSPSVSNRAQFVAEATGYEWTWKQTHSLGLFDEGVAILSKFPILETVERELPHRDLGFITRFVLGIRAETPSGPFDFYSTHMTVGGSEDQSADQAVEAHRLVSERSANVPAILAGDLNAEPETPAMRFLRGEAEHTGERGAFIDAWLATSPGEDGFTIDSEAPRDRIDYVYVAASTAPGLAPGRCELLFTEPRDGVFASDHFGVGCVLEPPGLR